MKQSVAVVGATNFFGRHIVDALKATDWARPVAVDHRLNDSSAGIHAVRVERGNAQTWKSALEGCSAVVVCTFGGADVITSMMRDAIEAVRACAPQARVVNLSSMTVYGEATGLIDESQTPVGALSDYASARLEAERIASSHSKVVTLRPGCEYGPDCYAWSERIGRLLMARRLGDLGARGDGYCNLVYIDDLVTAVLAALTTPSIEGEAFNLGVSAPPTWNEYFIRFGLALGAVPVRRVTKRRLTIETKALAVPLKLGEIAFKALGAQPSWLPPAIPPSLLQVCRQEIRLDVTKAEKLLAMTWTPIDVGLKKAAASLVSPAAALAHCAG
jgi:nucleoside-diphosphate-sugar epimerase